MNPVQVKVYLVDDEPDVTRALSWLLDSISVPSIAFSSAKDFFDQADLHSGPSCIVLDLRMPDVSGLDVIQRLNDLKFEIPVIFLSAHGDIPAAVRAMQLGAMDFLQKPFNPQAFLDAINKAMHIARSRYGQQQSKFTAEKLLRKLSVREREVLEHLLNGATSKEIARILNISYKTVDVHRANVLRKLEVISYLDLKKRIDQAISQKDP